MTDYGTYGTRELIERIHELEKELKSTNNMKPKPETAIRNNKMIADYEKVPRQSMASIGRKYGVTRSYVNDIIKKHYKNT